MQLDPEQLATTVAAAIKLATAPLLARVQILEKLVASSDAVSTAELREVKAEVSALRLDVLQPQDEPKPDITALVKAEVAAALAALPPAEKGEPGEPGSPGAPVELSVVQAMVQQAVAGLPPAEKGERGDPGPQGDPGAPGASVDVAVVQELVHKAMAELPTPKDGVSVVGAIVDREGHLIQTFSDGQTKDAGRVVGRDADPADTARLIAEQVAALPKPKDGRDGSLENIKAVYDGDRTVTLCHKDDTPIDGGVLVLPIPMDRGVYRDDGTYVKGDGVTFGGSFFIAQRDDPGKPEVSDGWRLAVKRGRDAARSVRTT